MTLPKLLFALMEKDVKLYLGAKGRIRFRPRGPVSEPMRVAIKEHGDAIRALLRGEDLDDWRRVRLRKVEDPEITFIGGEGADLYDADPELAERLALEDWERERELMASYDDPTTYQPFDTPPIDDDHPGDVPF